MKKLTYKKISHVLMVLGAKKKEVLDAVYESEDSVNLFLNPGELPPVVEASEEVKARFQRYMALESRVDGWLETKHQELNSGVRKVEDVQKTVHGDMIKIIDEINSI